MISLASGTLRVDLLDPIADRDRFGIRYCTGGYVFQIEDARHGNLLAGPTHPESFNWFDGQGIPDAFDWSPLRAAGHGDEALVLGVGVCHLRERRVLDFCDWEVSRDADHARFATRHAFGEHAIDLERTVSLRGRTLRSQTTLANRGPSLVPVRWFPHPFFPHPDGDELLAIDAPFRLAEGRGYVVAPNGFIARANWPWSEGHYLPLDHAMSSPPTLLVRHSQLGLIAAALSYTPSYFPIWGNARTFSFEPFLERTVANGQTLSWWIDYTF